MKQCITVEQLREVDTDKFIEVFYKDHPNKQNVINNRSRLNDKDIWYKWISKEVTIGKMIEILNDNLMSIEENMIKDEKGWYVCLRPDKDIFRLELCDALWEAVKAIL